MKRLLPIGFGIVAILASGLLIRTMLLMPPAPWLGLLSAALAAAGFWAVKRSLGWLGTVATGTAAAVIVLLLPAAFWPGYSHPAGAERAGLVPLPLRIPAALEDAAGKARQSLYGVPGLRIAVFAAGLEAPRMLIFGPDGHLYVSLPRAGQVAVLPDHDGDGVADRKIVYAEGLNLPHGLAFDGSTLVVAENNRLIRLPDRDGDLRADSVEVLSTDLPGSGGHWTRSVIVGTQGAYLVAAGSSCNACLEQDPRRAALLRIPPDGGPATIHARGLRNSVGLALHPVTGELWASDNGRDRLGDDLPPEEINRIVAGGDYGWPYCFGQRIPDPEFGRPDRCRATLPPEVAIQAHSAPLGIAFGQGLDFPTAYRDMLYVAYHGSWNRSVPTGYKLVGIPFKAGRPAGPPRDIVSGWLQGRRAWGRPVDPAVGPDGALYLSDDRAGVIYRMIMTKNAGEKGRSD